MIRLRVSRQYAGEKMSSLARSRAFAGLRPEELARVVPLVTRTRVKARTVLVGEERPDDVLYLVVRGAVELRRHGGLMRYATAGDVFIGAGLTASTVTPVTLLVARADQRRKIAELTGRPAAGGGWASPALVFDFRRRAPSPSTAVRARVMDAS